MDIARSLRESKTYSTLWVRFSLSLLGYLRINYVVEGLYCCKKKVKAFYLCLYEVRCSTNDDNRLKSVDTNSISDGAYKEHIKRDIFLKLLCLS
jgi:hypothetical protein